MKPVLCYKPPSPPLRGWVRQHQVVQLLFDASEPVPVKPYWPRPAAALAFYPRSLERVSGPLTAPVIKPRAALIGQPTTLTHRQGGHDFWVYQIEFDPGALHRLLGLPVSMLTDDAIDAEAVFPAPIRSLVSAVTEAQDADTMIALAEAYLLGLAANVSRPPHPLDWAAARLADGSARSLDRLARQAGVSPKQFYRVFRDRMGVSPKLFARIGRFDRLVRARNAGPDLDWLSLAIDAGYYDHQHMARDFRELCQLSPSGFYALEQASPERQAGLVER